MEALTQFTSPGGLGVRNLTAEERLPSSFRQIAAVGVCECQAMVAAAFHPRAGWGASRRPILESGCAEP
jgi:hypothetical protein